MGTQEPTPEELQAQLEEEQRRTQEQVDNAAQAAGEEAQAQGLSEEEVNKKVQAARKEEKDKLYPKIQALTDSMKEVQETLRAEREEKEKIKREAEQQAEQQRLSSLSDTEKILESQRKLEEQLNREREARIASEEEARRREREAELREYRRNAIQAAEDAGEKLLPELVRGNTEEEIDASITIAKTRYAELAEQFKAESATRTRHGMPRPTSPSMEALEEEELSEDLTNIDEVKYRNDKAYRLKVQQELAGAYARSQGR